MQSLSVTPPGCCTSSQLNYSQHNSKVVLRHPKLGNLIVGQHRQPAKEGPKPELKKQQLLEFLAPAVMSAIVTLSPISNPPVSLAQTVDVQKGANLFQQSCIGCHDTGGNIIQPGATLFLKDLLRNGVDTEEEIYKVTYYGKGRMPGFGVNCTPRGQCTFGPRLSEDEIKVLAEFVKSQADHDWPAIVTTDGE